jgi:hypothetical protein
MPIRPSLAHSYKHLLFVRRAGPSVVRLCSQRKRKPLSGASIGVQTNTLQTCTERTLHYLFTYTE